MKVELIDNKLENRILLSMVTDPIFLSKIASKWNGKIGPLSNQYANLVGFWCVRHFNKYSDAPRSGLRHYFEKWSQRNHSEAESSAMGKYLQWLSSHSWDDLPDISSDQMLAETVEHINDIKLQRLVDGINADRAVKEVGHALDRVTTFVKEEIAEDEEEELFSSDRGIDEVFDAPERSIITFEDENGVINPNHFGLKRFFRNELAPSHLIAFRGPEKSGKTFLLVEMLVQALLSKKRVAFFEVGDMSRKQIKTRIFTRIAEHPYESTDLTWPCSVTYPITLKRPPKGESVAEVTYDEKIYKTALDKHIARSALDDFFINKAGGKGHFRLVVRPNFSVTVGMIEAKLFAWKMAGWVPEVLIIDYADILLTPKVTSASDFRHSVNEIWGQLRRLSEQHQLLIITATQADSESYRKELQDKQNFSEDKRQNAHVNGIIGINVTAKEKEAGIMRLNWVGGREVPYSHRQVCYLASCLAIANPAVISLFNPNH